MAKTVGARWQNLSVVEREKFEQEANRSKDKYSSELTEYRKTDNFSSYRQYLADFKIQQGMCQ